MVLNRTPAELLRYAFGVWVIVVIFLLGCTVGNRDTNEDTPLDQVLNPIDNSYCETDDDCVKSGCSGTICQAKNAEPMVTTCEWSDSYSCYQDASCGCVNNKCGWADQETLDGCVVQFVVDPQ